MRMNDRWGWLERKVGQKTPDTWKRLQSAGCTDLIPNFAFTSISGTADSGMGRVVTPWRVLGGGEIHTQEYQLLVQRNCWLCWTPNPRTILPFMPERQRIIYNGPPARRHLVTLYDMQGEGCLLLPRSSTGTLLLDPRPEVEHNFATSGDHWGGGVICSMGGGGGVLYCMIVVII